MLQVVYREKGSREGEEKTLRRWRGASGGNRSKGNYQGEECQQVEVGMGGGCVAGGVGVRFIGAAIWGPGTSGRHLGGG